MESKFNNALNINFEKKDNTSFKGQTSKTETMIFDQACPLDKSKIFIKESLKGFDDLFPRENDISYLDKLTKPDLILDPEKALKFNVKEPDKGLLNIYIDSEDGYMLKSPVLERAADGIKVYEVKEDNYDFKIGGWLDDSKLMFGISGNF